MFENTSEVLKSSVEVFERWNDTSHDSNWRSVDMQKVNTSDGRCVYRLVVEEGFFSYLINHVKCFLLASDYKKTMEEALQTSAIGKSIKERYVAGVNAGIVPFVRQISYGNFSELQREKVLRQERKATAILQQYHREFCSDKPQGRLFFMTGCPGSGGIPASGH